MPGEVEAAAPCYAATSDAAQGARDGHTDQNQHDAPPDLHLPPLQLLTLSVPARLHLHDPNPPDNLGFQVAVVSAVAATIDVTATLVAPALPIPGSIFLMRTTIQLEHDTNQMTFILPGGFTVASDTSIGSQACVDVEWCVAGRIRRQARQRERRRLVERSA